MNPPACQGEIAGSGFFKQKANYNIHPEHCPKFIKCSAPICPLDQNWPQRSHLRGERVCIFLTEAVKPGGRAKIRGSLPVQLFELVANALPEIVDRYGHIRRRLKKAAKTPSKLGKRPDVRMDVAA